ncbi:MAG: hypothetical protein HPY85_06415 [Anaerolineae bacterium]|nr:hypothetical protein [Anaerolineae bacterium]
MTEVQIVVPDPFVQGVTTSLAELGFFHQEDASYLSVESPGAEGNQWRIRANEFANMERHLLATMKALDVPQTPLEDRSHTILFDPELLRPDADRLEREVQHVLDHKMDTRKKIEKLQATIDELVPFADLDLEFDQIRNRRYVYSILGLIPQDNIQRLKTSLTRIPFALLTLKQDATRHQSVVVLLGLRTHKDNLRRAARSAYLNEIDLPDQYKGTPREIVSQLQSEIEGLRMEMEEEDQEIDDLRTSLAEQFQHLLWQVEYCRMMAEAMMRYGKLRYTYLILGYVPAVQVEPLRDRLAAISEEILVEEQKITRSSAEAREAPILLHHPGLEDAFAGLVTTYGIPGYRELDPTIFLALSFPILFGIMFGDVGHGLVLLGLGIALAAGKMKALVSFKKMGSIVAACGASSIVFGFVFGSIFGFEELLHPIWIRPMENIMTIILVAIGFGSVILTVAYLLSLLNAARRRAWSHFLFGGTGLSALLLYWSLLGLAIGLILPTFPVPTTVLVVAAVVSGLVTFFSELLVRVVEHRKPYVEGGIGLFLVQSFFEFFEIMIGYLSNTLSYARVGAFAVAHAGLTSVVFILANMFGANLPVVYWLVIVLGSLFVVGFEGMIVGIQTLRLEYYEFFSKFFGGGGRRFEPLQLQKMKSQGE